MILIISTDSFVDGFFTQSFVTYKHNGTSPFVVSGTPKTAASATSGCRSTASSKLDVDILCPATLMTYKIAKQVSQKISLLTD